MASSRPSIPLTVVLAIGFAVLGTLPLLGLLLLDQTRLEDAVLANLQRQLVSAERQALATVTGLQEDASHVMPLVAVTVASDPARYRGPAVDDILQTAIASIPAIDAMYVSFEDGSHRVVTRVDADRRRTDDRIPAAARWHVSWIDPTTDGTARTRHRTFHAEWGTPIGPGWSEPTGLDLRTLPHYRRARETNGLAMVEPTLNPDTGFPVVSLAHPIVVDGEFIGILGVNLTFRQLSAHLSRNRVSPGGWTAVLDAAGHLIAHPDPVFAVRADSQNEVWPTLADIEGTELAAAAALLMATPEGGSSTEVVDGRTVQLLASPFQPPGSAPWTILTAAPEADFVGETRQAHQTLAGIIAGITILQILLIGLFARRVGSRIEAMSTRFQTIRSLQFKGETAAQVDGNWIRELADLESGFQLLLRSVETFSRFVPRRVVAHLLTTDRPVRPAVEQRDLALFFCDLQGFTALAEQADPHILLRQVSEYFDAVTAAITDEGGTIDKFIGDAVMAFWGAPDDHPHPAGAAARAALRVSHRIAALQHQWKAAGLPPLKVRIGLHIAPVLVGTIGTDARLSYTALGDGVNVAARLEGANRALGTAICASDAIQHAAPELACRPLRRLTVKGRSEPLLVHELLGVRQTTDPELQLPAHGAARIACGRSVVTALVQGDSAAAVAHLQVHLASDPTDRPAAIMLASLTSSQEPIPGEPSATDKR